MIEVLFDLIKASIEWAKKESNIKFRGRFWLGGMITTYDWDLGEDESNAAPYGVCRLLMQYERNGSWIPFMDHSENFEAGDHEEKEYDIKVAKAAMKILVRFAIAGVWQHFIAVKAQEANNQPVSNIIKDLSDN